jgi:hypothetical protein
VASEVAIMSGMRMSGRADGRERVEQTRLGSAGPPQSWLGSLAAAGVGARAKTVSPGEDPPPAGTGHVRREEVG